MFGWYKRWRHSRGYGVHSPYAYKIVTEVLQSPRGYAYYGYEILGEGNSFCNHKFLRRLLRLAAYCDVGSAYIAKDKKNQCIVNALQAANSDMKIIRESGFIRDARLIILRGGETEMELLEEQVDRPGKILYIIDAPQGLADTLFDSIEEGVMFYSRRNILLISRAGMQKVKYSICGL